MIRLLNEHVTRKSPSGKIVESKTRKACVIYFVIPLSKWKPSDLNDEFTNE